MIAHCEVQKHPPFEKDTSYVVWLRVMPGLSASQKTRSTFSEILLQVIGINIWKIWVDLTVLVYMKERGFCFHGHYRPYLSSSRTLATLFLFLVYALWLQHFRFPSFRMHHVGTYACRDATLCVSTSRPLTICKRTLTGDDQLCALHAGRRVYQKSYMKQTIILNRHGQWRLIELSISKSSTAHQTHKKFTDFKQAVQEWFGCPTCAVTCT